MQNRRQRLSASYQVSPHTQTAQSEEGKIHIPAKTWFYIVIALLVGIYLLYRGQAHADTPPVVEQKNAVVSSVAVRQPKQQPFPTINTTDFTATQRMMLQTMRQEYSKQPASYDKNVMQYTEGSKESWCADFVSWVRFQADKPLHNYETGYWRISGVQSLRDYYAGSDAYHLVGAYTPKFGDVAFYFGETPDGNNREHVAFVLEVRGETLVTIGGNETDKGILQIRYDKLSEGVKGLNGFGESNL